MNRLAIFLAILPLYAGAFQRVIDLPVDVSATSEVVKDIEFYQAESVQLNLYVKRNGAKVALDSGLDVVWRAWVDGTPETLYINATGTVFNAASGQCRVSLTPAQANMTNQTYRYTVQLYDGATYMGVGASGELLVRYAPQTGSVSYVGTTSYFSDTDTLGDLTPTAGRLVYGNGTAWATLAAGTTGQVLTAQGAAAPVWSSAGAGDITGGAVSGGLLTVSEAAGILTYGLTTNAVRSAVDVIARIAGQTISPDRIDGDGTLTIVGTDGMYIQADASGLAPIEVSGITTTNSIDAATINATDSITVAGNPVLTDASDLNASNLSTGTIPDAVLAAKYRQPVVSWSYRDLTLQTTAGVGWTGYEILAGSRRFGLDAISAAASDDQLATLRTDWQPVPATFAAFKSAEALRIIWVVNSAAGVTEIRGIRLTGKSALTGTETILYTDTTTRDVVSSGVPIAVSIARSSFASTTVPAYIAADVDFSVEDGEKAAVVSIEVLSE